MKVGLFSPSIIVHVALTAPMSSNPQLHEYVTVAPRERVVMVTSPL